MVKCLRRRTDAFLDCHFAVNNPGKYVARTAAAGGDMFTFHIEAVDGTAGALEVAQAVRSAGMLVGLAVKPDSGLEEVLPLLDQVRRRPAGRPLRPGARRAARTGVSGAVRPSRGLSR